MSSTSEMTPTSATTAFDRALVAMETLVADQVLVSQDRCVDGLLDLYNTAPTNVLRHLVAELIDEIRHVSSVRADELAEALAELSAAASVETAFFG